MNTQSSTPVKRFILLLMLSFAFVCFRMFSPSLAQNSAEREIEDKIPRHLPLKVKFKKEKEEKIKDVMNDDWFHDFELEVTNTSDKPIYFLNLYVLLPDLASRNGGVLGMPLRYGRMAFIHYETKPLPDDVPIKPGESYSFKILETDQNGWDARKARGDAVNPRKIQLIFSNLSFGDGTGFTGTTGVPYPHNKDNLNTNPDPCAGSKWQQHDRSWKRVIW